MAQYVQSKDGKMAGSIGDGKANFPTVSPTIRRPSSGPQQDPEVAAAWARYQEAVAAAAQAGQMKPILGANAALDAISSPALDADGNPRRDEDGNILRRVDGSSHQQVDGLDQFAARVPVPGAHRSALTIQGTVAATDRGTWQATLHQLDADTLTARASREFRAAEEANAWLAAAHQAITDDLAAYAANHPDKDASAAASEHNEKILATLKGKRAVVVRNASIYSPFDPNPGETYDAPSTGRSVRVTHQRRGAKGPASTVSVTDRRLVSPKKVQPLYELRFTSQAAARAFAQEALLASLRRSQPKK